MIRKIRKVSILFLALSLSACFGGGAEIPHDNFYRLADISPDIKPKVSVSSPFQVVAVAALKSDALHRERAILYSDAKQPLHVQRYNYHHWSQVPNTLIQEHLIDYLRKARFSPQVVRYGEVVKIDARITGYIKRFERIIDSGEVKVQVRLELQFETFGDKRRHYQWIYTVEQAASDRSMDATVEAFSQALESVYQQFLTDLANVDLASVNSS